MFFGAFLGPAEHADTWRGVVHRHADWLGHDPRFQAWQMPEARMFACVWLCPPGTPPGPLFRQDGDRVVLNTWGNTAVDYAPTRPVGDQANVIGLDVSPRQGTVAVCVPPLTPEHCYLARDERGYMVGTDLRLMVRWAGLDLDERAVFALMRFGTLIPPFTLAKGVSRVAPGHVLRFSRDAATPTLRRECRAIIDTSAQGSIRDPEERVSACMDAILARAPRSSVLYFSGGVDSGVMAARLAAIGRRDVTLVHYSFGRHDAETALAAAMAAHLNLRFECVPYDSAHLPDVLGRLARDYSYPFDDYSAIPTHAMVHATLRALGPVPGVIEGAAADDCFSIGSRYQEWRRLYAVPWVARRLVGDAHRALRLWDGDSRWGRLGRVARRSATLPLECAAIFARNALDGIAYHTPRATGREIIAAIETYVGTLAEGLDPEDRFSVLFMAHESSGLVAPKSFDPLRARGVVPIYPFLEPSLTHLSLSLTWDQKNTGGERKALLKRMLARQVPPAMVYRPKAGFSPPFQALLALPATQGYLHDIVLSPRNPLASYFDTRVVGRAVEDARAGKAQSIEMHFFLWALMFTSGWLAQLGAPA